MKILVITSRYTANKDIIDEDFGRQVRLFENYCKFGNKVDFFCLDYIKFESKKKKLHKISVFIEPFKIYFPFSSYLRLDKLLKQKKYDALFVTSDPLWAFFGVHFSKKYNIPLIYDIQDNFKVYKSFKIPIVRYFHKLAVKNAKLVTCASKILVKDQKKLREKNIISIPNGVDLKLFKKLNIRKSRIKMELPLNSKIISYIGSLQRKQGVDLLIKAFIKIKKDFSNLKLLIVGKLGKEEESDFDFSDKDIIKIGSIKYNEVVYAINSSDVLILPYPLNEFTRVMEAPYKIVEFMACDKPVVVTNVGDLPKLIENGSLVAKPGDISDLSDKIRNALNVKTNNRGKIKEYDWEVIAKKLDNYIKSAVN